MATIAAIATGDHRFNILVNALQYVDAEIAGSNLVATLADASTDLTVFAPTDAAFGRLAQDLGFAGDVTDEAAVTGFLVGALSAETIRDVILYHVSGGGKTLAEIAALATVDTLNGATITPDGVTLVDQEPDLIDPSLVQTDIHADNGVVHVIDRVLLPFDLPGNDAPTIAGLVAASGTYDANGQDFDLLLNAAVAADLVGALGDPAADLTAFAPNDAAFLTLARTLGYSGSSESAAFGYLVEALTLLSGGGDPIPLLQDILLYHVAPESLQSSQVLAASSIQTLLGAPVGVDGASLVDAEPDLANSNIVAVDIQAANGVVHVIDNVLLPADLLPSDGSGDVDFVIAGDRPSLIATGRDRDLIDANGGNDIVLAGRGADIALGGTGNDKLFGHRGNDVLRGEAGSDQIFGGKGEDVIDGGAGNDQLNGGFGKDTFVFAEGSGRDFVSGFRAGHDTIDVSGHGIESFAELADLISSRPGVTRIDFGDGDIVSLVGVNARTLDASDFIFA